MQVALIWSKTAKQRPLWSRHDNEKYSNDCPFQFDWNKYIQMLNHSCMKDKLVQLQQNIFIFPGWLFSLQREKRGILFHPSVFFWYVSDTDVLTNKNQGNYKVFSHIWKNKIKIYSLWHTDDVFRTTCCSHLCKEIRWFLFFFFINVLFSIQKTGTQYSLSSLDINVWYKN